MDRNYSLAHKGIEAERQNAMREIEKQMESLRKHKYTAISQVVGKKVRMFIRRQCPKPDPSILWIQGILRPFSQTDSYREDFDLCLMNVKYGVDGNDPYDGAKVYHLRIDAVESFEEVTEEAAERAASG